jgi:hypothetical protein
VREDPELRNKNNVPKYHIDFNYKTTSFQMENVKEK